MCEVDILEKQKLILGRLFLLPNRFQAIGDRIFAGEMTLRQWILTLVLAQYGDSSPTLGMAAELMGCSHQNVKQIALKLEKGGFLELQKDKKDMRVIHLNLTEKSCIILKKRQGEIMQYLTELFKDLNEGEIVFLYYCINKLYGNLIKVEKELPKQGERLK